MISFRTAIALIFLFMINANYSFSQFDSSKIKIGPEELSTGKGGNYFNYADKNKVNIEITIIGGAGTGRYLIPEGTTVFEILLMSGGTGRRALDEIKLVRFASSTPKLKINEVINLDFADLYSDDMRELVKANSNPVLKPGDMLIVPAIRPDPLPFWTIVTQIMSYVTTLISFYYVISNVYRNEIR
ncbi:MAG: hypothetical protein LH629_10205 [Ignavibacteria bacterium]|nr:hypothetical protein [Ignavibacteria bacterium]